MMAVPPPINALMSPPVRGSPLRRAFVAAGLSFLLVTISVLVVDVVRQVEGLTTSSSDNVQWTLSQVGVDFSQLRNELLVATLAPAGSGIEAAGSQVAGSQVAGSPNEPLAPVRHRFDIFYSRMGTVNNGSRYVSLHEDPAIKTALATINRFLEAAAVSIDSDDATLRAAMAEISEAASQVQPSVRDLSMRGIADYAVQTDRQRLGVAATLFRLGLVTLALVGALATAAVMLYRLFRHSQTLAEAQSRTTQRLETIVSTSLDAILVADSAGRIVDFNGAAEQVFGYSRAEAVGQPMTDVIFPDHLIAAHQAGMARYLAGGERRVIGKGRVQLEARRRDGSLFPVELSIAEASSHDTRIFVSFLRDISERVAAENDLRHARDVAESSERAKAGFLAVMSHEMRTPLNGLLGSMELLRQTALDARQLSFLSTMETSGRLLLHHVNDVLDISGLEAGKTALDSAPFALVEVVSDVIESQRPLAEARGNRIALMQLGALPPMVCGDVTRVRQILLNLVGNAVKFTAEGRITLELEQTGESVVPIIEFRVIDTGIGIAEGEIDRIFEDFVTLDGSYRRDAEGTGLGLGIARRLATAMGGEIGVESVEGAGSLFWVRLPLPEPMQQPAPSPGKPRHILKSPSTARVGPLSVLVVEDNQVNRLIVREFLTAAGHVVSEATDGVEGLAAADAGTYDVILMDISMPRMDGVQVTRRIRAGTGASARTPILALTAHALPAEIEAFLQAGFDACLTKPISKARLIEAVMGLCEAPAGDIGAGATDLLDVEQLETMLAALGTGRAGELIGRFIAEADTAIAIEPGRPVPQSEIHRLAGSSGTFGATALQRALARVETALKQGEPVDAALAALGPLWAETRPLLAAQIRPAVPLH